MLWEKRSAPSVERPNKKNIYSLGNVREENRTDILSGKEL